MRKRKLLFTLLAASTLMTNTSTWTESNSEIENYKRYADYEIEHIASPDRGEKHDWY